MRCSGRNRGPPSGASSTWASPKRSARRPRQSEVYTFWDYQGGAWDKNDGIRIDHVLLTPQAADRLVGAGIDQSIRGREKPSDHVPVVGRPRYLIDAAGAPGPDGAAPAPCGADPRQHAAVPHGMAESRYTTAASNGAT